MKEKASLKTEIEEQTPPKAATASKPTCLHRQCRCKFSCGIRRLEPAPLLAESLDDRLPGKGIR